MIKWIKDGNIAIITMMGKENLHNLDFIMKFFSCLDEIKKDILIKSVILTSNDENNFSLGLDLAWVESLIKADQMSELKENIKYLNTIFKEILYYPLPIIAAINGRTVGNGALLACACDFRFMIKNKIFSVPEAKLGILLLPGLLAILNKVIPKNKLNKWYFTGEEVSSEELKKYDIIEELCENKEDLLNKAKEFAKQFNFRRKVCEELKKRNSKHIVKLIENEDRFIIHNFFNI